MDGLTCWWPYVWKFINKSFNYILKILVCLPPVFQKENTVKRVYLKSGPTNVKVK
jgi:hypothetical protein